MMMSRVCAKVAPSAFSASPTIQSIPSSEFASFLPSFLSFLVLRLGRDEEQRLRQGQVVLVADDLVELVHVRERQRLGRLGAW